MALVDWRILNSSQFLGRVAEDAGPREQARTFLQVSSIIRSENLHAIILDMDDSATHMPEDAADFGAGLLAEEMADAGLKHFALVDRGRRDAWWKRVTAEMRKQGVAAASFETVAAAKAWLSGR